HPSRTVLGIHQVDCQLSVAGMGDIFPQLLFVCREYENSLSTARNSDIPLLLICRGTNRRIGKNHIVASLALGGIRRDSIAAHKLAVIFRQDSPVFQFNLPAVFDSLD